MDTSAALRRTFSILAIVLACCLVLAFGIALATLNSSRRADRRLTTLGDLGQVLVTMTNAEAGQRGYLLTGDPSYLQTSVISSASMSSRLDAVDKDVKESGVSPLDAAELRQTAEAKMAEIQRTIDLYSHGQPGQAIALVKTNQGLELKVKAEVILRRMLAFQSIQLRQERTQNDLDTRYEVAVFALATFISLGSLGIAYRRMKSVTQKRDQLSEELTDQKDLLQVTLSSIGDGVIVTDVEANVTFMNDVALSLTKRHKSEVIGQPCSSIFQILNEETREVVESPVDKVLQTGKIALLANHTVLVRPDGSEIPIDDCGAPVRDAHGNLRGVVLVFRDFGARREAQRKLHDAVEEAAAASVSKDNFLARLSHELRTPLTPLKATLSEWKDAPDLSDSYKEDVEVMLRSVVLEARLIDDLLDLGRITRGDLRVDPVAVEIHALIHEVNDIFRGEIRAKSLVLETDLEAQQSTVLGDAARLQQVFWNVLSNAIKFTPANGRITITTSNPVSGRLQIKFADTGIGMSQKLLGRVFRPFEHGPDEIVRQYGGLGLGLAISQALMEAQNGTIEAQSAGEGYGSTFTIALAAASGATVSKPKDLDLVARQITLSLSILLVEDHEDSAYVLGRLLGRHGHTVRVVATVKAALEAFEESIPDILISDLGLPDRSGFELMQEVRRQYGLTLPAIALSGYGHEEDIAKSIEAGFNKHVTKPVSFQRLENAIREIFPGPKESEGHEVTSALRAGE